MSAYASTIPLDPLLTGYDWSAFESGTIVDVGGGYGAVSIGIAKSFPQLKFVVQDFSDVIADGLAQVPAEFSNRISFMAYDMMNPQIVKDADIYLFRGIFPSCKSHKLQKNLLFLGSSRGSIHSRHM